MSRSIGNYSDSPVRVRHGVAEGKSLLLFMSVTLYKLLDIYNDLIKDECCFEGYEIYDIYLKNIFIMS